LCSAQSDPAGKEQQAEPGGLDRTFSGGSGQAAFVFSAGRKSEQQQPEPIPTLHRSERVSAVPGARRCTFK